MPEQSAAVTVRVRRSDGGPAAGAIVSVPRSTAPVPELALVADAAGIVILYLPPGRFTVEAVSEDGGRDSVEATVGGGELVVELRV